jgi:hypothetical protein
MNKKAAKEEKEKRGCEHDLHLKRAPKGYTHQGKSTRTPNREEGDKQAI